MQPAKHFFLAFFLGFIACAVLVFFYRESLPFSVSTLSSVSAPLSDSISQNKNIVEENTSKLAVNSGRDIASNGAHTTENVTPEVGQSEAEYWLARLREVQEVGTMERVVEALLNYGHYELDANKLQAVLDEFKVKWLHSVNQFLNNTESLNAEQINELELQRFINRLEQLLVALPSDAELYWLLSRLYLLDNNQYQADYYAVMAASDPRFAQQQKLAEEERAQTEIAPPIEAPLIIPLRRHQNHFLVSATISGQSALLLLDTGASLTGVTQSFAERYPHIIDNSRPILLDTAGGSATGRLFTANTVELGGLLFRDHPTIVFPVMDEQSFDGVLGLDILGRFDFYIDQSRAELHLRYRIEN